MSISNPSNPQIDELALSDINMDVTTSTYYDLELSYMMNNLSIQKVQELPEVQEVQEVQIESMIEDTVDMQVD